MIRIGKEWEHVDLIERERSVESLPGVGNKGVSVGVQVSVKLGEFSGSYGGVWLLEPDLERFSAELAAMAEMTEASEKRARIACPDPDEFALELRRDRLGGVCEAEVKLRCFRYGSQTRWPIVVSGGFEFECSDLVGICRGFRSMAGLKT